MSIYIEIYFGVEIHTMVPEIMKGLLALMVTATVSPVITEVSTLHSAFL